MPAWGVFLGLFHACLLVCLSLGAVKPHSHTQALAHQHHKSTTRTHAFASRIAHPPFIWTPPGPLPLPCSFQENSLHLSSFFSFASAFQSLRCFFCSLPFALCVCLPLQMVAFCHSLPYLICHVVLIHASQHPSEINQAHRLLHTGTISAPAQGLAWIGLKSVIGLSRRLTAWSQS